MKTNKEREEPMWSNMYEIGRKGKYVSKFIELSVAPGQALTGFFGSQVCVSLLRVPILLTSGSIHEMDFWFSVLCLSISGGQINEFFNIPRCFVILVARAGRLIAHAGRYVHAASTHVCTESIPV